MKAQACEADTKNIKYDWNSIRRNGQETNATKHTHEVQAKSTCKFGAHDKRLACLGVEEYSGKKCIIITEKIAGEWFSLRGAELEQGKNKHS